MYDGTTHGIVHAGFGGLSVMMARKKGRCKLIGNRFVIPHDTIPSNVSLCKNYHKLLIT
jgi:mannitol/fructose-specific phosphotransferase system IIA component